MAKTNKHSIEPKKTRSRVAEIYKDLYTGEEHPIPDTFFERLALDFTKWARDNENAVVINQFAVDKGIPWKTFCRWCKNRKEIKEVYEDVKNIIAIRRETKMLFGAIKEKSNMYMMHRYHQDWNEADHRWSEINAKAQEKALGGNINVVIQAAENTDVKPMRKNADVIADQEDKDEE